MKLLCYILFLLLTNESVAQTKCDSDSAPIPVGSGVITVSPVSFNSLLKILNEHNLTLGKVLEGKLILTRRVANWNGLEDFAMKVKYKDGKATLSATYLKSNRYFPFTVLRHDAIEYGKPGCKKAFDEMNTIAHSLHANVKYK